MRRGLRWLLQLHWFGLIPLLLSGLVWRYLLPRSSSARGVEGALASLARAHGLWCLLVVFLCLTAALRYWRNWLPGGRYTSSLPDELVSRVPRRRIAVCEAACALLAALDRPHARTRSNALGGERQESLRNARAELARSLSTGKWSKVPLALAELEPLARPLARPARAASGLLFCALLAVTAVLALHLRSRYLQIYEVNGSSMLPSLTPGETLAGGVVVYGAGQLPRRGDVIVLRTTVLGQPREVIKRVVGLPGDRIAMNGVHPIINGWQVPICEIGAYYQPHAETTPDADPSGLLVLEFLEGEAYLTLQTSAAAPVSEYVVKPDEVFVLGDNRSNSLDSRAFDHGAPRGFPLADVRAKISRVLFRPTARGDIDLSPALRPLAPSAWLDGADLRGIQGRIAGCLALRPKTASPPRSPSAALAFHD